MEKGKSDKENHSGRGLKIVNKIVEKYPFMSITTYHNQEVFVQGISI